MNAPALNVTGSLKTENEYIEIMQSDVDFGDVGDGGEKTSSTYWDFLLFKISGDIPDGDVIFTFEINADNVETYADTLIITVIGGGTPGPLTLSQYELQTSDGDDLIEQGEVIVLPVEVLNNGTAPAGNVILTLSTASLFIQITRPEVSYGMIGDKDKKWPSVTSGFLFEVCKQHPNLNN